MKNSNRHILKFMFLFGILFIGCNADLETKNWATDHLKYQPSQEVVPNMFGFYYAENEGVALDTFSSIPKHIRLPLIFGLTGLTSLFLWFFVWTNRFGNFWSLLPIFLILSGAFGNILDRAFNGYVVDFIHVYYNDFHFPIFNIADILVFSGVILFIFQHWKVQKSIINP